jgi:hypothetical protein
VRSVRAALATIVGACLLPVARGGAAAEEAPPAARDFAAAEKAFQADFGSKEPARRLRAFGRLVGSIDLRAVELAVSATDKAVVEEEQVRQAQAKAQADLSKVLTTIEKTIASFDRRTAAPTESEIRAFNARVGKLEAQRDEVYARMRTLEETLVRARTLVAAGTAGVGDVVEGLGAALQPQAVARLDAAWLAPASTPAQRVRYVDALAGVEGPAFDARLRVLSIAEAEDARVRVAAVDARLARGGDGLHADVGRLLATSAEPVRAATIDALRRLHRVEGIEPLIAFLGREDIGRQREDAHRALRSLTGQEHGPYAQPWTDWWTGAKEKFALPAKPADATDLARPKEGVTYHGITTFSDKLLFVLDVSKSMDEAVDPSAKGPRAEEPKIDVARRELVGALGMLDAKKAFNLLFFGHDVIPYKPGMLAATPVETQRAKAFVTELKPSGGTNIHDALEASFRMAGFSADQRNYPSLVDTIYFLTDGKPTAGKVQDPERILETVREWNRTARITIHCIGMGDHDPGFLQRLATESGGQYVKR